MVPKGWVNSCVENNISFSGGSQPPRSTFKFKPEEGYIRLIQIRDYKTDKFETYIPTQLAKKFCTVDDVMIGRYGPPIFQILRGIEGAYNVALIKATPKKNLEKDFMYYFLTRDALFNIIESHSQRTSGQTGIEMDVLKSYPMPLPPINEQKKIANILSTWDKAIGTTERLIENSTQQKKALMQQLLTGKKRLLDESGKRFEGEWENQSIKNLTNRVGDGIHSTPKYTDKSSIRFVNGNNLNNGSIVFSDLTKFVDEDDAKNHYRNLSSRTILMSINGTIGNLAIYNNESIVLGKSACYINVKEEIDVLFIFYKLASSEVQSHFISRLTGSTIKNLSLTTIKSTQVALPSLKEQQKIATVLTNADKEIELLEQQLADLQQEKKALMQVLLTGKVRVVVDG